MTVKTSPRPTATQHGGETILFVSDPAGEYDDSYLSTPVYYDTDGNEHTLQVGDVIRVQFASEEAFGYSSYEEVQVVKFNKASVQVRRLGRIGYSDKVQKRINFSKISEGEVPGYTGLYAVSSTVYFVRTAAEQAKVVKVKVAEEQARNERAQYRNAAERKAQVTRDRDVALTVAKQEALVEAKQAILAKYEAEIAAVAIGLEVVKTNEVNAEYPVVEGVYVLSVGGDRDTWSGPSLFAFDTEDEAIAFGEDEFGGDDFYLTVSGPVTL